MSSAPHAQAHGSGFRFLGLGCDRCRYYHGERIGNALVLDEIRRRQRTRDGLDSGDKVGDVGTVLPNHCVEGCECVFCVEEARYGQESS